MEKTKQKQITDFLINNGVIIVTVSYTHLLSSWVLTGAFR